MILELENRQAGALDMSHGITAVNHLNEPPGNAWMIPVAVVPNQYLCCRGLQGLFSIVAHVGISVRAVNEEDLGRWENVLRCIAEVLLYGCDGGVCPIFGPYPPCRNQMPVVFWQTRTTIDEILRKINRVDFGVW